MEQVIVAAVVIVDEEVLDLEDRLGVTLLGDGVQDRLNAVVVLQDGLGVDKLHLDEITELKDDTALVENGELHDVCLLTRRENDIVKEFLLTR